ncbi:Crp/Fnr family transcriptional regulator [Sulfurimonas autotrophica]|uniref:Putative transcriptional regulator, Crp/Fnr family n=1 Tax=Sulfurimonas autotrophica (strain ATCC BAA-671 / DSM 16294 / JCM 11897 / OK10) TaxID=563040 RepID=E0URE7_SULAO|nr:Crp/Fnr family transcriptional regulator [Sulfurimonas autotrophica]ADN10033.1 putative transcriptional regulator, Crp/Fnr family [Sulfurimonas autotrophica DSM 16294]
MSIKDIIKSQTFFSSLNDEELDELVSISLVHHYKKDYILHYENINTNELFFLIDGLAKAYKIDKHDNEIFLYYIYGNSMISEVSNIDSDNLHSFSNIQLIDDSQILSINYKKFKENFLNKNILCKNLTKEIIKRSLQLQSLVNREFIFDAVSKVSMMLHDDLEMFNKLKRHDISLMLHIQPATLSRVLNRLKRNGIIDIIHGRVTVIDAAALQEIYKDKTDD